MIDDDDDDDDDDDEDDDDDDCDDDRPRAVAELHQEGVCHEHGLRRELRLLARAGSSELVSRGEAGE